jgi:hypothetical protein
LRVESRLGLYGNGAGVRVDLDAGVQLSDLGSGRLSALYDC